MCPSLTMSSSDCFGVATWDNRLAKGSTGRILVSDYPIPKKPVKKPMRPRSTLESFDRHLLGIGLCFEGVVIGGSALGLMGAIQRHTRDFDILVPELPPAVADLARRLGHGV